MNTTNKKTRKRLYNSYIANKMEMDYDTFYKLMNSLNNYTCLVINLKANCEDKLFYYKADL